MNQPKVPKIIQNNNGYVNYEQNNLLNIQSLSVNNMGQQIDISTKTD